MSRTRTARIAFALVTLGFVSQATATVSVYGLNCSGDNDDLRIRSYNGKTARSTSPTRPSGSAITSE